MSTGKVIGANLKYDQVLRTRNGLGSYLMALTRDLKAKDDRLTVVRVFPHWFPLMQLHPNIKEKVADAVDLGAQDIHYTEGGSFTNAPISAKDLVSLGYRHTLIGHSETRVYFGVTDAGVAKKLDAAFRAQIFPTVCLGENIQDKKANLTGVVLKRQIEEGIIPALVDQDLSRQQPFEIAYEPVYAIAGFAKMLGLEPGKAEDKDIVDAHTTIREVLSREGFQKTADNVRILYGGSAKPSNAEELLRLPGVDGLLVGTASWEVEGMIELCRIAETLG
ncbi:MAG: triose-phosphate isomerase [Candidatus Margulisiibacteriota bacterium]